MKVPVQKTFLRLHMDIIITIRLQLWAAAAANHWNSWSALADRLNWVRVVRVAIASQRGNQHMVRYRFHIFSSFSSSSFQSVCPALITTTDSCGQALRHCNLLQFWAQNWQSQCHIMKLKKEKANETSATSRTNRQYLSLLSDEPPSTRWPADVRSSFWPLRVCLVDKKKEERK